MHDLIVVGSRGKDRATEVLTALLQLAHDGAIDFFDGFLRQAGGMIQPGDSAVFAVLETKNLDRVIETFRGCGGSVLRTTLPPDVVKRVHNSLTV